MNTNNEHQLIDTEARLFSSKKRKLTKKCIPVNEKSQKQHKRLT